MPATATKAKKKPDTVIEKKRLKPRAQRLAPEARKAQLLETAIRVFAAEGISHSNHSQIAKQAGVSLASVFAYFPTHEDLTRAVLKEVSRFMLEELVKANQQGTEDALSSIENTLIGFSDMIDHPRHCDYAKVWFDWSTAIRESTWPLYLEHHVKVLKVFETTLRRGKTAGEVQDSVKEKDAAWVLVGVGHMIAHMKFAGESKLRIVRTIDQLVRSYFHT